MRAFIRVIYSSEGRSPSEVLQIMHGLGFEKVKGQPLFVGEVADEEELSRRLEEVHVALRGMEVRYIPSLEVPTDDAGKAVCNATGALAPWRALGIDVDELETLLNADVKRFRERALLLFKEKVDAVAEAKEKELAAEAAARAKAEREREERERAEGRKQKLTALLANGEGATFQELHAFSGYEMDELIEVLKELIDGGKVKAAQKGKNVVYSVA